MALVKGKEEEIEEIQRDDPDRKTIAKELRKLDTVKKRWIPDEGNDLGDLNGITIEYTYKPNDPRYIAVTLVDKQKYITERIKSTEGKDQLYQIFPYLIKRGIGYEMGIPALEPGKWSVIVQKLPGWGISTYSYYLTQIGIWERYAHILGPLDDLARERFNAMPDIVQKTIMNTRDEIISELGLSLEKILKDANDNKIMSLENFERVINSLDTDDIERIGDGMERTLDALVLKKNGISVDTYKAYSELLNRKRTGTDRGKKYKIRALQAYNVLPTRRVQSNFH